MADWVVEVLTPNPPHKRARWKRWGVLVERPTEQWLTNIRERHGGVRASDGTETVTVLSLYQARERKET